MSEENQTRVGWVEQGMVVQHKSGGPIMVVISIYDARKGTPISDRFVNCSWWDAPANTFKDKGFRIGELIASSKAE